MEDTSLGSTSPGPGEPRAAHRGPQSRRRGPGRCREPKPLGDRVPVAVGIRHGSSLRFVCPQKCPQPENLRHVLPGQKLGTQRNGAGDTSSPVKSPVRGPRGQRPRLQGAGALGDLDGLDPTPELRATTSRFRRRDPSPPATTTARMARSPSRGMTTRCSPWTDAPGAILQTLRYRAGQFSAHRASDRARPGRTVATAVPRRRSPLGSRSGGGPAPARTLRPWRRRGPRRGHRSFGAGLWARMRPVRNLGRRGGRRGPSSSPK